MSCPRWNPRAASDWSKYASFNLVTCATIPFSEGGHGVTDDNNCSQNIVRVVRTAATADDVGGSGGDETSSYELAESYSRDEGNSVVGVSADFSTYNLLDLSGAYHNTSADTAINGWLTVPISNAMVEGGRGLPCWLRCDRQPRRLWISPLGLRPDHS